MEIKLLERSCKYCEDCELIKNGLDDTKCRKWCKKYIWDGKTLPTKPEFFTEIQLKSILNNFEEFTLDQRYDLKTKINGCLDLIDELQKDKVYHMSVMILQLVHKLSEVEVDDFKANYLILASLKANLREYLRKIRYFD